MTDTTDTTLASAELKSDLMAMKETQQAMQKELRQLTSSMKQVKEALILQVDTLSKNSEHSQNSNADGAKSANGIAKITEVPSANTATDPSAAWQQQRQFDALQKAIRQEQKEAHDELLKKMVRLFLTKDGTPAPAPAPASAPNRGLFSSSMSVSNLTNKSGNAVLADTAILQHQVNKLRKEVSELKQVNNQLIQKVVVLQNENQALKIKEDHNDAVLKSINATTAGVFTIEDDDEENDNQEKETPPPTQYKDDPTQQDNTTTTTTPAKPNMITRGSSEPVRRTSFMSSFLGGTKSRPPYEQVDAVEAPIGTDEAAAIAATAAALSGETDNDQERRRSSEPVRTSFINSFFAAAAAAVGSEDDDGDDAKSDKNKVLAEAASLLNEDDEEVNETTENKPNDNNTTTTNAPIRHTPNDVPLQVVETNEAYELTLSNESKTLLNMADVQISYNGRALEINLKSKGYLFPIAVTQINPHGISALLESGDTVLRVTVPKKFKDEPFVNDRAATKAAEASDLSASDDDDTTTTDGFNNNNTTTTSVSETEAEPTEPESQTDDNGLQVEGLDEADGDVI